MPHRFIAMALFKKKVEIASAMRTFLSTELGRDLDTALSAIKGRGVLSDAEFSRLQTEIPSLGMALWFFRFNEAAVEKRVPIEPFELGRQFGVAVALALRDNGFTEDELDAMWEVTQVYMDVVSGVEDGILDERGPYFLACQELPRRVLDEGADLLDAAVRERLFEVFNIAKQIDVLQSQLLATFLSHCKLINS